MTNYTQLLSEIKQKESPQNNFVQQPAAQIEDLEQELKSNQEL